jgi:hypothetical protein
MLALASCTQSLGRRVKQGLNGCTTATQVFSIVQFLSGECARTVIRALSTSFLIRSNLLCDAVRCRSCSNVENRVKHDIA